MPGPPLADDDLQARVAAVALRLGGIEGGKLEQVLPVDLHRHLLRQHRYRQHGEHDQRGKAAPRPDASERTPGNREFSRRMPCE
jgi:hypothetical protein